MTIFSGISLHSLLDVLPAQTVSPALAVSGQGIVLLLQAVAYVLVSLAAIAVLLRFGLSRNGQSRGGCGCGSKQHHHDASSAAPRCNGAAKSDTCCGGHSHEPSHGAAHSHEVHCGAAYTRTHEPHARHADGHDADRVATHNGEARPLAYGRLPDHGRSAPAVERTDIAAAHIRAVAAPVAAAQSAAEDDAAEQRRITAVIAAAVHNVLGGQQHRIVRIQPISHGWAQEGRRDIFSSHRFR